MKAFYRAATTALCAIVAVGVVDVTAASADEVPAGCVGSVFYVCTGGATPPAPGWNNFSHEIASVPVTFTTPGVALLPGQTVGGQQIGGVLVPLGGQTIPGVSTGVGPTAPADTGLVTPVQVCAFVTCIPQGTPVAVPGVPLPVVPVVIPATTLPSYTADVPVVATVPYQTTPAIGVPESTVHVTTITVRESPRDEWGLGVALCEAGGGETTINPENDEVSCSGGPFKPVAEFFYQRAWRSG